MSLGWGEILAISSIWATSQTRMKFIAYFLGLLILTLGPVYAQYQPSYATERWIEHIHVAKDWSERRRLELDFESTRIY